MRTIQEELEKKLAGQNKLSRRDEGLYDAMKGQSVLQHSTVTGLYTKVSLLQGEGNVVFFKF